MERVALVALVGVLFACGGRALVGSGNEEDGGADSGGLTPAVEAAAPDGAVDAALDAGGWHPLIGEIDPTFVGGHPAGCGWSPGYAVFGIAPDDTLRLLMQGRQGSEATSSATCYSRLDRDGREVVASRGDGVSLPSILGLANDESVTARLIDGTMSVARYDGAWGRLSGESADAGAGISSGGRLYREAAGTAVFVGRILARIADAGIGEVTPFPGPGGVASSTLDPAGRVMVTTGPLDAGQLVAVRPDFTLDPAFGDGGFAATGRLGRVASTAGGRAYVAIPGPTTRVLRFTADGALDTTFGSGGSVDLPLTSRGGVEVATERDGRLLVMRLDVSVVPNRAALSRLTLAGEIDTTFGTEGTLALPYTCALVSLGELAFQSDGRVVLVCGGELMRVR